MNLILCDECKKTYVSKAINDNNPVYCYHKYKELRDDKIKKNKEDKIKNKSK